MPIECYEVSYVLGSRDILYSGNANADGSNYFGTLADASFFRSLGRVANH